MNTGSVLEALELLLEPGAVAELRAIGRDGRIMSGYFDRPALLAERAEALDASGDCQGVYVTLNPVHPALLSRRANRVQSRLGRKDATTADADILRRRWLPIDIDPVRPSGVSSSDAEHEAAVLTAEAIREYLDGLGWPTPIVADSGNGAHLLYLVDLPNDAPSTDLVRAALAALDTRFSNETALVDTANFNAGRIWKLYGTVSRKGDSTADRPHRRSGVVARPAAPEPVPVERLRALAGAPPAPKPPQAGARIDLGPWLAAHGIGIAAEKTWQGGTLYTLEQCPFSDAHTDGAYAVQLPNGAIHAGCRHDSCGGGRQRWQELRERFDPRSPGRGTRAGTAGPPPPTAPPSEQDPGVRAKAEEILETGDPIRYFLDCFGEDHVGDTTLARCLVMSIASQTVRNAKGLHVYVTGESGKGKSSGMTAMLRQVPEEYRLAERMSNKALYYSSDINPGTVLLDDIALSEELQEVLKESTSKFTEPVRMRTVDTDRKVRHCSIPERCTWWLANVSALYDDQVLNRMLICWVDDSEVQDREVFLRRMNAVAAGDDDGAADRFDLAVCRECWRLLRSDGPVPVRIPFAGRIRMASLRNRRNHEILLDLVRAHALVFRYQRGHLPLEDGTLAVVATEEDFRAAAALFVDLHAAGGSLSAKFDRNEEHVLSIASRNHAEQFTVGDIQQWTGWTYQKARRLLVGRNDKGRHYPGLLDKSPALTLIDRTTTSVDENGRDVRHRQLVFAFDEEVNRETQSSGQVWLDNDPEPYHDPGRGTPVASPVEHDIVSPSDGGSAEGTCSGEIEKMSFHRQDPGADRPAEARDEEAGTVQPAVETRDHDLTELSLEGDSEAENGGNDLSTGRSKPVATGVPRGNRGTTIAAHGFVVLEAPVREPCSACGRSPSHYRETRPKGAPRYLCRACHGAAVRREQRAVAPLPAVIDYGVLAKVAASLGLCNVCGLEPAAWSGDGVMLCDACYRREVRRGVTRGDDIQASA